MSFSKKGFYTLVATIFSVNVFCQGGGSNPDNFQKMTDILPPPPNAAAIIKYGGISVSQNTGAPNINIPIYTVQGKNISVPISLNYASTGIKVDEIASRAGMGWVLKAGGVITRTVRGWADETHPRIIPWEPVGFNWGTFKFMKDISDAWFYGGVDAEPDLFSFSFPGGGGSFVLDHLMNPVQQTYSNQIIVHNFAGTDWNFKITDANGIEYYFGGTGRTEKTKRTSTCGKSFDGFITTAWYLKKILHPSGEEIIFDYSPLNYTYETGLSQTYDYTSPLVRVEGCCFCPGWENGCPGAQSQAIWKPTCINKVTTEGIQLDQVTCTNTSQKVTFGYTSRLDCSDKLISSISLVNTVNNAVEGQFSLAYDNVDVTVVNYYYLGETESNIQNTPYLMSLVEAGAAGSGVTPKAHYFQYLDPQHRSKRLSYAQDHWGYFNGKVNTNLLPKPPSNDLQMMSRFPDANADREPDGRFGAKGMLCGIVYPTGGKDSIIYEANQSTNNNAPTILKHEFNCTVIGTTNTTPVEKTAYIYIGATQAVKLHVTVNDPLNGGPYPPPAHGRVVITNYATGASFHDAPYRPGIDTVLYINLTGSVSGVSVYKVAISSGGIEPVTTTVQIIYNSYSAAQSSITQLTGGQRVKSILTSNENNIPMIKRYYYGNIGSLNASSGITVIPPGNYMKSYEIKTSCFLGGSPPQSARNYCQHTSLYSSSLGGLYTYQSSPVSYGSVIESIGDDFEGGATQSKFQVVGDQKGVVLWGNELMDAPLTAFSNYGNGNLIEQTAYKKSGASLIPVKKTSYTFSLDSRGFKSVWGYVVNKKFEFGPTAPTTDSVCYRSGNPVCVGSVDINMESFDMMKYEFPSYWIYNNSVSEYVYDPNGQNPVLTQTTNIYDNAMYQQLSRTETINSKGELLKTEFKYPNDFAGTQVYDEMTSKNIIAPVITAKSFNGTSELSHLKNNYYKDLTSNKYAISSIERSEGGSALEQVGQITTYDIKGNICEYKGKDGVTNVVIWGYNYLYPVAKIVGATYAAVTALIPGGVPGIQSLDGSSLLSALHNIRTGLPSAFVTTYTYKHLGGVKTITDPENRTNSYSYDGFNRLLEIMDKDGNVVKKNEYTYSSTQLEKMGLFVNDPQSAQFTTQGCTSGYTGTQVTYGVNGGTYFSVISVTDANAKALADIQINGQAYANRMGSCVLQTSNCTGEGYAIIGCGCEFGQKICVSQTENPPNSGNWTVHYRYKWSDGSELPAAPDYLSANITCTGVANKMIGCECKTGIKVYTSSTLITTGPNAPYWLCEYHYHWPDGSDSVTYTEINSSSCPLTIQ